MSGIGSLLHLAALFERGQVSVAIARNIGAGDSEETSSTQREPTGAGSLAQTDASPDAPHERAGLRPALLSLAGLTQPQPSLGMDAEKAAQLLLMLNGLAGTVGSRGSLLASAGTAASPGEPASDDPAMGQTATPRAGSTPGSANPALANPGLMAAALAAMRAITDADHQAQDSPDDGGARVADGTAGAGLARAMRDAAGPSAPQPATAPPKSMPPTDAGTAGSIPAGLAPAGLEAMLMAGLSTGTGAGDAPALQTERAGVIASFILNAAMLPGWPERRFLPATPYTDALARQQAITDEDIQAYLASLGWPQQGTETAESSRQAQRRRRLLAHLAMLVAQLVGALDAIEAELRTLADSAIECADLPENLRTRMSL